MEWGGRARYFLPLKKKIWFFLKSISNGNKIKIVLIISFTPFATLPSCFIHLHSSFPLLFFQKLRKTNPRYHVVSPVNIAECISNPQEHNFLFVIFPHIVALFNEISNSSWIFSYANSIMKMRCLENAFYHSIVKMCV